MFEKFNNDSYYVPDNRFRFLPNTKQELVLNATNSYTFEVLLALADIKELQVTYLNGLSVIKTEVWSTYGLSTLNIEEALNKVYVTSTISAEETTLIHPNLECAVQLKITIIDGTSYYLPKLKLKVNLPNEFIPHANINM